MSFLSDGKEEKNNVRSQKHAESIHFQSPSWWLWQAPNKGDLWGDSLPSHSVRAIKTNERNSLFEPVLKSNDDRKRNPAFYIIKRSLRAGGEAVISSN